MPKNETLRDAVAAAREELRRAEDESKRENERLAQTIADIETLTSRMRRADPDDDEEVRALAADREVLRARSEAVTERAKQAAAAVDRAKERLAEIERQDRAARLAQLDTEIKAADAKLTADVVSFYRHLLAKIRELRRLVADANTLGPHADASRASRWANASLNKNAWKWAIGVLPDSVPGEEG